MSEDQSIYRPSPEIVESAHVPDYDALRAEAARDPQLFWESRAKELLDWYAPWEKVLDDSDAPFFRWFTGGKTNVVLNALDRHQATANRNKLALVWEGWSSNDEIVFVPEDVTLGVGGAEPMPTG